MTIKRIIATSMAITMMTALQIPAAHSAGRSTKQTINTILNGKGAPKSSVGIDGDFYIDTRSLLIYGPKRKGKWPAPQNLQGPTGPSGSDGRNGNDGKTISSSLSSIGTQGPQGVAGPQGPQGLPGEKGDAGPAGLSGPAGAPGSPGPAGAPGAQGATGPAGATGAQGISEVIVLEIQPWTISSDLALSYSTSAPTGNLIAGRSYFINMHLTGSSGSNNLLLGLDLICPGATSTFSYSRNDFRYATYSGIVTTYSFDLLGVVQVGSSETSLNVRVIDGLGDSGNFPLTLSGKAYITPVGSVR